ncbi:ferritin-like domain-containing protein [Tengunoibacter tsumagoiensis]|uniref:Ferritin-like domain-containing protein n=1 Tax=Tengunoibacter tsumagoiensis TaxID=2014871 RepID=A0A401ZZG2_9CHLR|nr:ferritin-like domain-containing protein [Tengunoibacter tsumagoiensis]GCE12223.1 hypothetical protein KTT_20820 [Tengunoibacter tsumagoiensis]
MMHTSNEDSLDTATDQIMDALSVRRPRRHLLKGAIAAGSLASAASLLLTQGNVSAHGSAFQDIINIAVTAERLAVTTYSYGIYNASTLGLTGDNLSYLQAALVEEQIHELFFESLGAIPLTSTFSYPNGSDTFTDLSLFIQTQQQLEGIFDSAFLAAIPELASLNYLRFAQIFGQIATIEAEHRVLGRVILDDYPANNYAFTPIFIRKIGDAPDAATKAGYLSPTSGNSYTYQQVDTAFPGIDYRTPFIV